MKPAAARGPSFPGRSTYLVRLGALVTTLLLACHRTPPPETAGRLAAPPAASLPPPDAIPGAFTVRQKLVASSAHGGGSFEAVLKKVPGHLTLLGLTPYGSRAFLLEQAGADVSFTSYIPRELPFPPTYVLLDVHRVFDALLGPSPGAGDGKDEVEREGIVRGELVRERWRGGHLVQRTFMPVSIAVPKSGTNTGVTTASSATSAAAPETPLVTVSYEGQGAAGLPAHVTLVHHRFGYRLEVDTLPL